MVSADRTKELVAKKVHQASSTTSISRSSPRILAASRSARLRSSVWDDSTSDSTAY
jgi:hypothetical protein